MTFQDEMFELLEEAEDRAVWAQWRQISPKMTDQSLQDMWMHLVKKYGRVKARNTLRQWCEVHEKCITDGETGMFDEFGEVLDD
jgi:hypothetical protein